MREEYKWKTLSLRFSVRFFEGDFSHDVKVDNFSLFITKSTLMPLDKYYMLVCNKLSKHVSLHTKITDQNEMNLLRSGLHEILVLAYNRPKCHDLILPQ
eukprot:g26127.t1